MHRATLPLTSLITIAALAFSGCADLPPGQPGMFSENAGVAASGFAQAGGTSSAEAQATGASSGAIVSATIQVIASYRATERQRLVAEKRARAAVVRLRQRQARETAPVAKPKKSPAATPPKTKGKTAATMREVDVTQLPVKKKKKLPRYIAVDTVPDERAAPQAARSVMIFDTQTEEIVGNNVYDVRSTPPVGGTARFETFTAEYVGAGS